MKKTIMMHAFAFVVLLMTAVQAAAQTPPVSCSCTSSGTLWTCEKGKDCSREITVEALGGDACQVNFGYCGLCVIGDGASDRFITWKFAPGTDPKYFFRPSHGIDISPTVNPPDFVDAEDQFTGLSYKWRATKTYSTVPRSHTAWVSNGRRFCVAPSLPIANIP